MTDHAKFVSRICAASFLFIVLTLSSGQSFADKLSPSLLQIEETAPAQYQILWRTPLGATITPEPILPGSCSDDEASIATESGKLEKHWTTICENGLRGTSIGVAALDQARTVAMLRFQPLDGSPVQTILTAETPSLTIPDTVNGQSVFQQYILLGFEHILAGVDHLFFITALLLLSSSWQGLVKTVTSFTLGHSVTLALVSSEVVQVWPPLVEFAIALTILILALELSRPKNNKSDHTITQHQWPVAAFFGLIHGLGFAGALQEIGIPSNNIVSALLAFNIGIEFGQLAFVGVIASVLWTIHNFSASAHRHAKSFTFLSIGSFSAYWCIDRGTEMLTGLL